ncbi:CoA-binding protein [Hyphomicrobium sulfonivorans]|uniref:CoA-binding protein n=1 Tax=Hyphomicrobium sulfonivorans TaxID=121290 RepID=UPI00157091AF|nr:CoA-binding protein [Hyphomicrobium sulfonivorans]MBI1651006.1 CoA-binding protein [Hyphomicrobium sulfonivorans]NSL72611.1 CoA-binding protein [Hyphomicrobium sulfonivorans]
MYHDHYSDDYVADILRAARVIAVLGASPNPARPSYGVMQFLIGKGYTVHPVNPGHAGGTILGRTVYARLADVPAPVDLVDIFRNQNALLDATRQAIADKDRLGIGAVWMQLGLSDADAAREAEAAGLQVVMNRCPKIEYGRLEQAISRD